MSYTTDYADGDLYRDRSIDTGVTRYLWLDWAASNSEVDVGGRHER